MIKRLKIVPLCIFSFLCIGLSGTIVYGDTPASGVITSDTTWTKANSPYVVVGNIGVEKNTTLTVEPGVQVNVAGAYYIGIKGRIIANGTETEPIVFTSLNQSSNYYDWQGIQFITDIGTPAQTWSGSLFNFVEISHAKFGIIANMGFSSSEPVITITNSVFHTLGYEAINIQFNSIISSNYITNLNLGTGGENVQNSAIIVGNGTTVSGNIIENSKSKGIIGGVGTVAYNILNNLKGVAIDFGYGLISHNLIYDNQDIAIVGYGSEIRNNTIYNNKIGIAGGAAIISHNNIFSNRQYNLFLGAFTEGANVYQPWQEDVDAKNNWWGSTVETEIAQSIYDYYDDFQLGKVIFSPWLLEPEPDAPVVPPTQYTLTVTLTGSGSVSKNPNKATYNDGEQVTLMATPNSGYSFSGWSGDINGNTNPYALTMNGNKNITANFTQNPPTQYTLTVTLIGSGSVSKNPNKATYNDGEQVTLMATPNPGYSFGGWSGDINGNTNPYALTMNGNKNITANFTQNPPTRYTLTVNVTGLGSVSKNPNKSTYNDGEQVTLTAISNSGYSFSSWSGDLSGTANPTSITMNSPKNVIANFTSVPEIVSTPNTPSGPTSGTTGTSYTYSTGGSTSNLGHTVQYFFDWGDGTNSGWVDVGTTSASHSWSNAGTYIIKAQARCATDTTVISNWSSGLSVVISSSTASVHCDFNSDGKTDILWRNKSTGQNVVWFMNGAAFSSYAELLQVPDTNWQIVGTGDFNGDGKTDVLWRNTSTGQNVVWLMDGVNYGGYAWLLEVADLNWEIVGTGDFNSEGKTDILWRNRSTGQNVVWLMNGVAYSSYAELLQVPDTNWEIVGTGDFNGDGKTDILWRNRSTGQNVVWLMNGVLYSSYAELLQVTDTNWQIVGTGDFNSDGKTDIVWRNKTNGQNIILLMSGTTLSSFTWLPEVSDTNWEIVGPK